jgi:peptide/nickel transport system substrate-binding protein
MHLPRIIALALALVLGSGLAYEFTYIESQEVTVIDPALHTDESSLHAVLNMYDPLVYPKVQEGLMEPGPHIAESWSVSEDGRTYTFELRQGVQFQDGSELTAQDVVFSMQRMLALQKGFSWLFSGVLESDNVRATGEYTVEFELNNTYAPFVPSLTQLFIVNKDQVTANLSDGEFGEMGDYGQAYLRGAAAGSGPYRPVRYERATILELERFDDYWRGWEENQIERILYRVVEEEATLRTLLSAGRADMIDQWQTPNTYAQLARTRGVAVQEDPSAQLFHIPLNTQRAPLDNLDFRKAIVHAFDYQTALEQILQGAVHAQGPVPITAWRAFGREPQVEAYQHDLELARQHLEASGVDPAAVQLTYVYPEGGNVQRQMGLLLQSNLSELGIRVRLQETPWARIVEMSASPESTPDMAAIFDTLKYPHPDSHLFGMYHPSALGSYRTISRYDEPDATDLLEEARRTVDIEQQLDLYQQAERLIVDDYPSIFVANPVHRIAFRDHVKGYRYVGLLGYDVAFYDFRIER